MITLIDTDLYALKAEIDGPIAFLHMNYKPEVFTKSVYCELLLQWDEILKRLKESGIQVVASLIPKEWDKVQKWQGMFGLTPTHEVEDKILFRREL